MLKYIIKRIFYIIFVLFLVSILLFSIFVNMPGDPALMMIEGQEQDMTPEQWEIAYQRAREILGLDDPMLMRYFRWLGNTLTGNFGWSSVHRMPVIDAIRAPMANTIVINIFTLILVFSITIPIGVVSAIRRGGIFDNTALFGTMIGFSIPTFLFALIMIFIFAITLQWLPLFGMSSPIAPPRGTLEWFLDRGRFMTLPLITMVLGGTAGLVRIVRASMIDSLTMDYIRTARSKGLKEKTVIYSHAFRNALIPVITVMTGWFIGVFGGSVAIERMFSWNGMGNVMITSLVQRDFGVVMTMNVFYALIAFVGLLLMDIAYAIADPRIKFA